MQVEAQSLHVYTIHMHSMYNKEGLYLKYIKYIDI